MDTTPAPIQSDRSTFQKLRHIQELTKKEFSQKGISKD